MTSEEPQASGDAPRVSCSTLQVLLLAAFDGLAAAMAAALLLGGWGAVRLVDRVVPGPAWVPGPLWLVLSLAAPLALALCAVRLRPEAPHPRGAEVLGRTAGWLLLVATAAGITGCGLALCDATLVVILAAPAFVAAGIVWVACSTTRRLTRAAVAASCGLLFGSLVLVPWPLALVVWVLRSPLDALADRAARGETLRAPEWVGPFRVDQLMSSRDVPFLITDPDPAGAGGLARCDLAGAEASFNLWSARAIGGGWCVVFED